MIAHAVDGAPAGPPAPVAGYPPWPGHAMTMAPFAAGGGAASAGGRLPPHAAMMPPHAAAAAGYGYGGYGYAPGAFSVWASE